MKEKPAYEELERRVQELEKEAADRTLAEEASKDTEERNYSLFELSPYGILTTDLLGTITSCNKSFLRLSGYGREQIVGKHFTRLPTLLKQDINTYLSIFKTVIGGKTHEPLEFKWHRSDGAIRNAEGHIAPLKVGSKIAGIQVLVQDITDRKQAEEIQQNSEARMKALSEAPFEAIFLSEKGICLDQNQSAERMFGYTREEAIGRHGTEWITPEDREQVKNYMLSGYEKPYEVTALHKDGSTFPCEIQARMINYKNRSIRVTALRDITERKQAEEALKESEKKYRLLFDNANDAILIAQDGVIKFPNSGVLELTGYTEEELSKFPFADLIHPEDRNMVVERYKRRMEGDKEIPSMYTFRVINKAGHEIVVNANVVRIDWEGRPAALSFVRDITHQRNLEAQLQQTHKMESIGTLAGGIAHEINNILGIIIGNTELAIDEVPEQNPAKEFLEETLMASIRAKDVVRQIMSFARKTPDIRKPIRIGRVVKEGLNLIRVTIPTSIKFRKEIYCDAEVVLANPTEVNQILVNLCNNSIDAIEDETGILEVRLEDLFLNNSSAIQYQDLKAGKYSKLTVKDNGKGIRPNIMDRIFDPYFTTKDVDKGLGMGLAVVYGIVKKHDGAIRVKSREGKGTTVEVLFPIIEIQPEIETKEEDELSTGMETILFVDDEASLVKMAKHILERQGYKVVGKTDSTDALRLFQKEPDKFDLIISDMAMPGIPGDRLAREILKNHSNIPIILCTGNSERIDGEKAKKLGIAAYIMKPLVRNDLLKTVRRVLDTTKDTTK